MNDEIQRSDGQLKYRSKSSSSEFDQDVNHFIAGLNYNNPDYDGNTGAQNLNLSP